jgi:hypothetical protein
MAGVLCQVREGALIGLSSSLALDTADLAAEMGSCADGSDVA